MTEELTINGFRRLNKSDLAQMMLEWEDYKYRLAHLETIIKETILNLGETVVTGNVRATYRKPRKTYDYKAAAKDVPAEAVASFTTTKTVETTAWRALCLSIDDLDPEDIPYTESDPSVSLKLEE